MVPRAFTSQIAKVFQGTVRPRTGTKAFNGICSLNVLLDANDDEEDEEEIISAETVGSEN